MMWQPYIIPGPLMMWQSYVRSYTIIMWPVTLNQVLHSDDLTSHTKLDSISS